MSETVNHPAHYNAGSLEVIDAIEGLELGFHAGNVVKYVARYKHKNGIEDLRKAAWYLNRLIEMETKNVSGSMRVGLNSAKWTPADDDAVDLPPVHSCGDSDAPGPSA